MKIILVPYGEAGPVLTARDKADLILEEQKDGSFLAAKYSLGFVSDVEVTIWDEDDALVEKVNEIYSVLGVEGEYNAE